MTPAIFATVSKHRRLIVGGGLLILLASLLALALYLRQPVVRNVSGLPPFAAVMGRPLTLQRPAVLLHQPGAQVFEDNLLIAADDERNPGGGQALPAGSIIQLDGARLYRSRLHGHTQAVVMGHTQVQGATQRFEYKWGDVDLHKPVDKRPGALGDWWFARPVWQAHGDEQVLPLPNP